MSMHDHLRDEPPPRPGMSSTAKVLLILGSIAGVCLLACCGGGVFFYFKAKDAIKNFAENFTTTNPDDIRARTAKIMHIDIPEEFPPMQAFDWMFMKQIIYGKQGKSMVMIIEMNQAMQGGQGAAGAKQQREAILQQLRQQQGQQPGSVDTEMTEESSETREFTINGEKVPFEFKKGTAANGGAPTRQVVGVFQGRQGVVMLMLMVPESEYNEAKIVNMIESIRLPTEVVEPDSDEDADMHDDAAHKTSEPAVEKDVEPEKEPTSESTP